MKSKKPPKSPLSVKGIKPFIGTRELVKVIRNHRHLVRHKHIVADPSIMGGKPRIRGLRVTVGTIVGLLANGYSRQEILKAYPYLNKKDIQAALEYAAWRCEEVEFPLPVFRDRKRGPDTQHKMPKLTKQESELLASIERGEWKSVRNLAAAKRKAVLVARETLKKIKAKRLKDLLSKMPPSYAPHEENWGRRVGKEVW